MAQPDKHVKRRAKLKARKAQAVRDQQWQATRVADAIIALCESVLPEYIDDANGLDLTGRDIVWRMGMVAWNIAVSGRREIDDSSVCAMHLGPEEQQIVKREIDGIVRRKYENYPAMRTAVSSLSVERTGNTARPKVKLGDTFPVMPIPDFSSNAPTGQNITNTKESPMKHSFYDVKLRKKVTADVTEFVSYGEGKSKRFAFKAQTKDGRNLTAFVSKEDWEKGKKKK